MGSSCFGVFVDRICFPERKRWATQMSDIFLKRLIGAVTNPKMESIAQLGAQ